jgi:prepilin-type N-terminal cleavage/methylation domain-containing protein
MIIESSRVQRGHIREGHLTRGFTLIELLVVIALIGILSAVVLASLNTARQKGTDASIKSDLVTVQTQFAIDYDSYPNAYGNAVVNTLSAPAPWTVTCTGAPGGSGIGLSTTASLCDSTIGNALKQATQSDGGTLQIYMPAGFNTYVIAAPLTTTGAGYWCVDSTGVSKAETGALPASSATIACP